MADTFAMGDKDMELKAKLVLVAAILVCSPNSWAATAKDCENIQVLQALWSAAKSDAPAADKQRCSLSVDIAKACCVERKDKQPNGQNCYRNGGGIGGSGIYSMFKECMGASQNVAHDCREGANAKKLSTKLDEISKCYWSAEEQARKSQPPSEVIGCLPTSDPNDYCYKHNPASGNATK